MKRINTDILGDYGKFQQLVNERKLTTERVITLNSKKPSRPDTNYSETRVKHTVLVDNIILIIEAKVKNYNSFKFQLRCKDFTDEPYFRFDSDGSAHKNRDPLIPLAEQLITTPHFNSFDNSGRAIAYKTDSLKNPNEAAALTDINLCFPHFCSEANIRFPVDDFSEIQPTPADELPLETNTEDILSNINFVL
jgi:hypothetical protein